MSINKKKAIVGGAIALTGLFLLSRTQSDTPTKKGRGSLGGMDLNEDLLEPETSTIIYSGDQDTSTGTTDLNTNDTTDKSEITDNGSFLMDGTYVPSTTAGTTTYTSPITKYDTSKSFLQNVLGNTYTADGEKYSSAYPYTTSMLKSKSVASPTSDVSPNKPVDYLNWYSNIPAYSSTTGVRTSGSIGSSSSSVFTAPTKTPTKISTPPPPTSSKPSSSRTSSYLPSRPSLKVSKVSSYKPSRSSRVSRPSRSSTRRSSRPPAPSSTRKSSRPPAPSSRRNYISRRRSSYLRY